MKIPGHTAVGSKTLRRPHEGPWAWLAAASVALSVLMLGALIVLLSVKGLANFWPSTLHEVTLDDGDTVIGVPFEQRTLPGGEGVERRYWIANRDDGGGIWRWLSVPRLASDQTPDDLVVLERRHWGTFFGRLVAVRLEGERLTGEAAWLAMEQRLKELDALRQARQQLTRDEILPLIRHMEREPSSSETQHRLDDRQLEALQARATELRRLQQGGVLVLENSQGQRQEQPLEEVLDAWRPNAMAWYEKLGHWGGELWQFLSEGPRDANTAGGVWPAIFGTILMVLLMSVLVTPFGVLAAVYLNEVAHQGRLTRLVRIGVRNLAGVPSIVYGVFGLGVFVYGVGGSIDRWFFDSSLPSPTFGTGGLLWASLTLALLTLPVVIVATEEGLSRIPLHQREGALALGATRFETLTRVVLPMAMPAMLTGLILAVARAAGEVAPLMLVGVAKLAPQVPVDGEFPFLHLERKFMHLGYHIYDAAFHSSDVQAAMPLVYATALLLVVVILVLNLTAIFMRHYLRKRHGAPVRR
ncbi:MULTISPECIES: phosphate ABC transporter permease PstA [Halomonas]|uniref:phosphate ABC transporter permease PstA n=1 Tax=Halomonas TaxID=2745 RepID=UPI001C967285|nr:MULTISPECIES: phosphate ABC transporter permease PstA [Halomonas]MBY6206285.1 phosphate ABC transporter permease PstA [Halomonas sp. DP3Y7-2]MBY6227824.1 phosphate ABC transporter permease PstA [Halomonas sp. DP3Y7-1]MCA0915891.1 phosphate ABC transporter permease PstA [Halomonas denitrificans]